MADGAPDASHRPGRGGDGGRGRARPGDVADLGDGRDAVPRARRRGTQRRSAALSARTAFAPPRRRSPTTSASSSTPCSGEPRPEHGYCTDDVARALVVLVREPEGRPARRLAEIYLRFLEQAQLPDGRFRNRLSARPAARGRPRPAPTTAQGRALFGLGVAACRRTRSVERACFERSTRPPSRGERLRAPRRAPSCLRGARRGTGRRRTSCSSGVPAALGAHRRGSRLAVARAPARLRQRPALPRRGSRPAWRSATGARGGGLAAAPLARRGRVARRPLQLHAAGGWAPGEPRPGFDQQPLEAGSMADACARAFEVTGDERWAELGRSLAAAWFLGENDTGVALLDPRPAAAATGSSATAGTRIRAPSRRWRWSMRSSRRLQAAARSAASSSSVETGAAPTLGRRRRTSCRSSRPAAGPRPGRRRRCSTSPSPLPVAAPAT